MLYLTIKRYVKSLEIILGTIAFWGYILISVCYMQGEIHEIEAINQVLSIQNICFLFFVAISYEFSVRIKRDYCEEVISSIHHGKRKEQCACIGILLFQLLTLCVIFGCCIWLHGEHSGELLHFIFRLVTIHVFLLNLYAILLGNVFSRIFSRIQAYGAIVLLYVLYSPIFVSILDGASSSRPVLYGIADCLAIYSHDYLSNSNYYYLYSVENVNIVRILIWITLCLGIGILFNQKGKKRMYAIPILCACTFFVTLFASPNSAVRLDVEPSVQDPMQGDDIYYRTTMDCRKNKPYKDADFKIKSYYAKFSMHNELEAKVVVEIDKVRSENLDFTLYHGYRLNRVEDEKGNKVLFSQNGDYINFKCSTKKIVFYYKGCCKRFYSTSQGAFLPGNLAYYPMPGKRKVYIIELGYWGPAVENIGYLVRFDVYVDIDKKVACNLNCVGTKHFRGESDGLTIFASDFLTEMKVGKCRVITSRLGGEMEKVSLNKDKYQKFLKSYNKKQQVKTIFVAPIMNYSPYFFGYDQVIDSEQVDINSIYNIFLKTGKPYDFIKKEEIQGDIVQE